MATSRLGQEPPRGHFRELCMLSPELARRLVPLSSLVSPLSRTVTIADRLAQFQARFLGHLRESERESRMRSGDIPLVAPLRKG